MLQLKNTIRYLISAKGQTLVRILSLTLGLAVGLVVFARIAFDISYDNFYPDSDRLYRVEIIEEIKFNEQDVISKNTQLMGPVAPTMALDIPEVEAGSTSRMEGWTFYREKRSYYLGTMLVDSSFFDILPRRMIRGDFKQAMKDKNSILLAERTAKNIFGDQDPIGQSLTNADGHVFTVAGIYENYPKNSQFARVSAFAPLSYMIEHKGFSYNFTGGAGYEGFVKLQPGAKLSDVEDKIEAMMYRRSPGFNTDHKARYYLNPVTSMYLNSDDTKTTLLLLGLLGFAVLFAAGLNYALISLASLTSRVKSVALEKCNGALGRHIFGKFILETSIVIVVAFILCLLLLYASRGYIEGLIGVQFSSLFSLQTLWMVLLVIIVLFIISGGIPGRIFAKISVMQIFRQQVSGKRRWSKWLLGFQIGGSVMLISIMLLLVNQYNLTLNKDIGYDAEDLIGVHLNGFETSQVTAIEEKLNSAPTIVSHSIVNLLPYEGLNGLGVANPSAGPQAWFSSRQMHADPDFISTLDLRLIHGQNFAWEQSENDVIVNETFLKTIGISDNPAGQTFVAEGKTLSIRGVVKDFQTLSNFFNTMPIVIRVKTSKTGVMVIRPHQLTPETMDAINQILRETVPDLPRYAFSYQASMNQRLGGVRMIRDTVIIAAILIILIAGMGLIGYVNNEVRRRRKEIALRKINGATVMEILGLINRSIMKISLIAIVPALTLTYAFCVLFVSYSPFKITISWWLFGIGVLVILILITATTIIQSQRAANENPAHVIKSE